MDLHETTPVATFQGARPGPAKEGGGAQDTNRSHAHRSARANRTRVPKLDRADHGRQLLAFGRRAARKCRFVEWEPAGSLVDRLLIASVTRSDGLFEGKRIDTITEGMMVEAGDWVKCIDVRAAKVVVRPIPKPDIGLLENIQ